MRIWQNSANFGPTLSARGGCLLLRELLLAARGGQGLVELRELRVALLLEHRDPRRGYLALARELRGGLGLQEPRLRLGLRGLEVRAAPLAARLGRSASVSSLFRQLQRQILR